MDRIDDPLVAPPPDELPLTDAPLVRVIAQVRFPDILSIESPAFVAPFQEALRADYPVLRQERVQGASFGPDGVSATAPPVVWRFSDEDGDWRVSLSSGFLTLETARYESRSDLLSRLRALLAALEEHVAPRVVDRIGVRYIDRIVGGALEDIAELVRPELLGVVATDMGARAEHSLTESVFRLSGSDVLLARWGAVPANASADPDAIEPVLERSWILDLDVSTTERVSFGVDAVAATAERFAERAYTVFRWAVTPAFLRRYGGDVR